MKRMIRFIGLDVHKDFIFVAVANEGRGEVESYGEKLLLLGSTTVCDH